jgi:hypothetical protein
MNDITANICQIRVDCREKETASEKITLSALLLKNILLELFLFFYFIQHCFICRPSDFTVSEDASIEPRTVATLALTARRSTPLG